MSEVKVKVRFNQHPCTNHTDSQFIIPDSDCSCTSCSCEEQGYCSRCRENRSSAYCPDCGAEIEQPYCYLCEGENCGCGHTIPYDHDVTYTGVVEGYWKNGELIQYTGQGHPHLSGAYCLGDAAPLFEDVTTVAQAIEAIVTHISNVDFNDGVGHASDYHGIEA